MTALRIKLNMAKGMILAILYVVLSLYSVAANGQSLRPSKMKFNSKAGAYRQPKIKGLDATFGFRLFTLDSDLPELENLNIVQEGGSAGLVFGNRILRTKVGILGFFYSSPDVPRTINVFENEIAWNFFPLSVTKRTSIVEPYLAGGFVYNAVKFKGHYASDVDRRINTSAPEPTIGTVHKIDLSLGTGLEIGLLNNYRQFVHFFAEAKYGIKLYQDATDARLSGTSVSNQLFCSAGLRFGSFN